MPRSHKEILSALRERIEGLEAELDEEERSEREADSERERRESADDVRALRTELAEVRAELTAARESGPPAAGEEGGPPAPPVEEGPPAARRTRPGRKSGGVYQFDVDEDGNVVELELGRVYDGEDEPDEVELPDVVEDELEEPAAA